MTVPRQMVELMIEDEDLAKLGSIARSRTEPTSRVERGRLLLACRATPSFCAVGRDISITHWPVERCRERGPAAGQPCLADLARGARYMILDRFAVCDRG